MRFHQNGGSPITAIAAHKGEVLKNILTRSCLDVFFHYLIIFRQQKLTQPSFL